MWRFVEAQNEFAQQCRKASMHCNALLIPIAQSLSRFKTWALDERILIVCTRQEKSKELNCVVLPLNSEV